MAKKTKRTPPVTAPVDLVPTVVHGDSDGWSARPPGQQVPPGQLMDSARPVNPMPLAIRPVPALAAPVAMALEDIGRLAIANVVARRHLAWAQKMNEGSEPDYAVLADATTLALELAVVAYERTR